MESMVHELDALHERGLFTKQELQEVVKRRTACEYAIRRPGGMTTSADFFRYFEYVGKLEELRKLRRKTPRALEAAKNDLEACIAVAPGHVLARLRLATVLIHSGADAQAVEEQVEAAERLAPTMSEVYQVKGEVLLAKADLRGAIRQFDEAIRLDESNPVPLYNKGLTLIQMNQFEAHNAQKLFESCL